MRLGLVRKCFLMFICCLMLVHQQQSFAQAQAAAPVANFVVNRAIAGSLTRVAIARGFAANDPRIAATMVGVSSSMTAVNVVATVGGVALAVAGAPVWLTIAGGLGILVAGAAIVAATTSLSVDGGKVTVTGSSPAGAPTYVPLTGAAADADLAAKQAALGNPSGPTGNIIIDALLRDGTKVYRDDSCTLPQACMKLPLESSAGTAWVARRIELCGSGHPCFVSGLFTPPSIANFRHPESVLHQLRSHEHARANEARTLAGAPA
ncbi:hypothetical protein F2P45_33750, partial [Massilia sp. CCM 8733]|nr:hypothetical protein [Massilia mucilaginosa]